MFLVYNFDEVIGCLEQYIEEFNSCTSINNNVNERLTPKSVLRKFISEIGGTGKTENNSVSYYK